MSPMAKALLAGVLALPLVALAAGVLTAPDDIDPDRSRPVIIGNVSDGDDPSAGTTDEHPEQDRQEPRDDDRDDDRDDPPSTVVTPPPRDLDDDDDGGDGDEDRDDDDTNDGEGSGDD